MGSGFNIEDDFDEDVFRESIADRIGDMFRAWVEREAGAGRIICDCGSRSFDVETWKTANGELAGAAVCRVCNDRVDIDIDTSDLNDLRG